MKCLALLLLLFTSCATSVAPPSSPARSVERRVAVDERPLVTMITTAGTLRFGLLPRVAPATVTQFLALARGGVYDSVYFYRVEQHFVAQTAVATNRDVALNAAQAAIIRAVPLEAGTIRHERGVLSLAHGEDPGSGETSFSILLAGAPHLDGKFTVFGVLESGEDVLRKIEANYNQNALTPSGARLQIVRMTVEP